MMDLGKISSLEYSPEEEIWFSKKEQAISYPADGNQTCYAIEEDSFWFQHRNRIITTAILQHPIRTGSLFFDIGGGNGFVAKAIQDAGIPLVLMEPGREGAQNARQRGIDHVACSTIEHAGLPESCMGGIGLFDVLEHMEDDEAFLRVMHKHLEKQGKIFLTVPAYSWLWSGEDVSAGHYRRYARKELEHLLEKTGFRVEFSSYFFGFLPLPILLLRAIPFRLGMLGNRSEKSASHHQAGSPLTGKIISWLLSRESTSMHNMKPPACFGGSIIIVANKP
jgi:SAM-dependent methyltransferase